MRTVSIIGVGLIGASFALAIRKAGFSGRLLGVSSQPSIEAGLEVGAIDAGVTLEEAAAESDLIYLSQPIDAILNTIPQLGPIVRPGCLVTDAGSTKAAIVQAAQVHLPRGVFLGGHPMAGKEVRGAHAADAELFRARPYVLTPADAVVNPNFAEFRSFLVKIGAEIVNMTAQEHDETVALTSHLPQLLSTALAITLARQDSPNLSLVFGPGLIDMTRLSMSAPEVWMSVLATNREPVDKALAALQQILTELRGSVASGQILNLFEVGRSFATGLREFRDKLN